LEEEEVLEVHLVQMLLLELMDREELILEVEEEEEQARTTVVLV
jgi:hypothetical protein